MSGFGTCFAERRRPRRPASAASAFGGHDGPAGEGPGARASACRPGGVRGRGHARHAGHGPRRPGPATLASMSSCPRANTPPPSTNVSSSAAASPRTPPRRPSARCARCQNRARSESRPASTTARARPWPPSGNTSTSHGAPRVIQAPLRRMAWSRCAGRGVSVAGPDPPRRPTEAIVCAADAAGNGTCAEAPVPT